MRAIVFLTLICGTLSATSDNNVFEEFVKGNHNLGAKLYTEILKNDLVNFVASPFSIETILAVLNEGARGITASELINGLSLPDTKEKISQFFKFYLPQLNSNSTLLKVLAANKIYVKSSFPIEDDLIDIATSIYNSEISNIDFTNSNAAVKTINKWVEHKTNEKIKNLVHKKDVNEDTRVILINTLYFSGQWSTVFTPYPNKKDFYASPADVIKVDTLYTTESLQFYESYTLGAKFVKLPIRGNNINLVIVLPDKLDGLEALEQNIDQLIDNQPFEEQLVKIDLPKFTTETKIEFKPILENLGIKQIFSDADLSGISPSSEKLFVADVIQKVFIKVNEKGIDAQSASSEVLPNNPVGDTASPKSFKVNRPFLYFIKHDEVVIFIGRVGNPNY